MRQQNATIRHINRSGVGAEENFREMINIEKGIHFNIRFLDVRKHPYHYHVNPEIIFLLSGRLHVQNGPERHILKAGDIYIMNINDLHHYSGFDEPNISMILEIDN